MISCLVSIKKKSFFEPGSFSSSSLGRSCRRLLLLLLPHDVGVPLFPLLQGEALVAVGGGGALLLGLFLLFLGRLLAGQLALVAAGHLERKGGRGY